MLAGESKKVRILGLFYRLIRGEQISPQKAAQEYHVSIKSITRDMNEIKNFLAESREIAGNAELQYIAATKSYRLELEHCLLSKELLLIMKILIASRAVNQDELQSLVNKLKLHTTSTDRAMIDQLIIKETHHYQGVKHSCIDIVELIWKLTNCIYEQKEITVVYEKMDGSRIERRLQPFSIMFSEYYFYLIAGSEEVKDHNPHYYRIDRISKIVEHRKKFHLNYTERFDEGALRKKIQLMFPGANRKVKFEFGGPSVQAVLDRLPLSRIVAKKGERYVIEADTYGTGINMFLLSQGAWVKVLEPKELVEEMKQEIQAMAANYNE